MKNIFKINVCLILLMCVYITKSHIRADNISFDYIVDTVGIPRINVKGEVINKDIYLKYNVFVYSSPEQVLLNNRYQRFKEVEDKGKYTYNNKKGEFFILGTNYDGKYVYNVNFPVDHIPEDVPENWNYIYYKENENSWNSGYKYIEQLDFMKNTNLLFDRIDLQNRICDSYDIIKYNVSPIRFGLGKFRLNTCSTWKTMGIVTARRRATDGTIRDVIFATEPMAASANIKSKIESVKEVYINEDTDNVNINITFGADATNLGEYAKEEHIKNITSKLYINGKLIDSISGSKKANVDKKINFAISRDETKYNAYEEMLNIEVESFLYTEFSVDGLLYDSLSQNILIKAAPKKLVPIEYIKPGILSRVNGALVVSPLVQTNTTNKSGSIGMFENGRYLILNLNLGVDKEIIEKIDIYKDDKKLDYEILKQDEKCFWIKLNLDKNLNNITIALWDSLRKESGNYFKINNLDIGKRQYEPNMLNLKVTLNVNDINYEYRLLYDVCDDYLYNINYMYKDYIINYEELGNYYEL